MSNAPSQSSEIPINSLPSGPETTSGTGTGPQPTPPSYELNALQDQVLKLQRQVAQLLESQPTQFLYRQSIIIDPPIFDGKSWWWEWQWKMNSKLKELESLDERTKIEYIVSRMTGKAVMSISAFLPPPLRDPNGKRTYRTVDTAADLMDACKRVFGMGGS